MTSVTTLQIARNATQPNDNTISDSCLDPTYEFVDWLKWSQVASVCIVGLFFVLQRRKRMCLDCTSGLPGVIYPVNLVDAYSDRFTFASAFCSTLKCILDLFIGVTYIEIDTTDVPDVLKGTVDVLTLAINVLLVCIAFYPIFLCLTTPFRAVGNAIGLAYTTYWTFYYVYGLYECNQSSEINGVVNVYLNGPVLVCYFILIIRFTWGLCVVAIELCTRKKTRQRDQTTHMTKQKHWWACRLELRSQTKLVCLEDSYGTFAETHYYDYVKCLLTPKDPEFAVSPSRLRKFLHKFYKPVPGFKYSRRFVCTIALSSLAVYQAWLVFVSYVSTYLQAMEDMFAEENVHSKTAELLNQTLYYSLEDIFHVSNDSFVITSYIAMAITVIFIVHAVLSYRQHTLMMYKGDYSFCPKESFPNWTAIVSGFRYTGYHIAYTIWGYILLHLCSWAVVLLCLYSIIYPFRDGRETIITNLITYYGLTLFWTYAFYYSQALGAFLFFLQNRGKGVLGIDNRRFFHNATYVLVFYNVVIGLASCLMRILKSTLLGLFYIGRLDRCLLMRGWELWDTGYRAYLGFLRLEIVHSHPVLITFCHFLCTSTHKKRKDALKYVEAQPTDVQLRHYAGNDNMLASENAQRRRKVARNRWFVAITLIRNSQLVSCRSPERNDLKEVTSAADDIEEPYCIVDQQIISRV